MQPSEDPVVMHMLAFSAPSIRNDSEHSGPMALGMIIHEFVLIFRNSNDKVWPSHEKSGEGWPDGILKDDKVAQKACTDYTKVSNHIVPMQEEAQNHS